jgi:hypothetical protein
MGDQRCTVCGTRSARAVCIDCTDKELRQAHESRSNQQRAVLGGSRADGGNAGGGVGAAVTELEEHRGELVPADASPAVFALFSQALEKGAEGAGAMETLYKLYTAEREHAARLAFARALARFQSECPAVPKTSKAEIKTKTGTTYGYTYADFEQVAATISLHLQRNGLSYAFDTEAGNDTLRCICRLMHVDGHVEHSSFSLPTATASAMSAQQAVGAALTFAKRQALTAVLGLALTDPDPDGAADPTTITAEQAADLRALVNELGLPLPKVLAYANASSVEEIRAADYARVIKAVQSKRGKP